MSCAKWINVTDRLPYCDKKPNTFGTRVLIYPARKRGGSADEQEAFFGMRASDGPQFYKYGAVIHGVTHWMPMPDPPTEDE